MTGAAENPIPDLNVNAAGEGGIVAANLPAIEVSHALGKENRGVKLSEEDRLRFARQILFFLFLFCLLVVGVYLLEPDNKAAPSVFELVKIGVLPLVTLVIGFYFPNNSK